MFFLRNQQLRTYHRMGYTHDDERYFLRSSNSSASFTEYEPDLDPGFSTVMSVRLAELLAYQDLVVYIKDSMGIIDDKAEKSESGRPSKTVVFTGSSAQFIEVVTGLNAAGVLNYGQTDLKTAMEWFQYFLSKKVTNYYGYFQSMRIRKKDRTPFLNTVIAMLIKRMDDSDEFPRFS
ncbi:MAG: RteC domain-containing protein [Sphingobacterium sp.]